MSDNYWYSCSYLREKGGRGEADVAERREGDREGGREGGEERKREGKAYQHEW